MATRAVSLSVKMETATKYYSMVKAVLDDLVANSGSIQISHYSGRLTNAGGVIMMQQIDAFFRDNRWLQMSGVGETDSYRSNKTTVSDTITTGVTTAAYCSLAVYFSYLSAQSHISNDIDPYVRAKIAYMTDADYAAFAEAFRTNVKAAYPADRAWVETNSPTA